MRGDIHRLRAPRGTRGHEQRGTRFAVVLQPEDLMVSTLIVAPTSTSAGEAAFRPAITVAGQHTRVMVEQMTAVAPARLGERVGHLSRTEYEDVNDAVRFVLGLD